MKFKKYDFAFLVHSRDITDIYKVFPIARFFPKKIIEFFCYLLPPVLVTEIEYNNNSIVTRGVIIGIPMTGKQIIKNKKFSNKRIFQAIRKAEKMGVKSVGLGALTSSVTDGGRKIKKSKLRITTGNSLTAAVSIEHVKEIIKKNNIKTVGIVGGTGSIGRGIVELIIEEYPDREFLIFAKTEKNINDLIATVREEHEATIINGYANNLTNLSKADLVIVTTSASDAIIHSEHLKKNSIVYDVTQPQNVDKNTLSNRKDLLIIDGGLIYSDKVKFNFSFGLPSNVIFSCLGETILLAVDGFKGSLLGKTNKKNIKLVKRLADKYGFEPFSIEHKL